MAYSIILFQLLPADSKDASCPIEGGIMHRESSASTRVVSSVKPPGMFKPLLSPSVAMLYRNSIFPYLRLARMGTSGSVLNSFIRNSFLKVTSEKYSAFLRGEGGSRGDDAGVVVGW